MIVKQIRNRAKEKKENEDEDEDEETKKMKEMLGFASFANQKKK